MRRFLLLAAILGGLLLSGLLVAQDRPTRAKVGYLDAATVVEAHQQFVRVKELQAKAEAELKPLREQIQSLESKIRSGNATAQEQQNYRVLLQGFQEASRKWSDQHSTALRPITQEIDRLIDKFAQEQGFAVVLDREVAARSGLVVYAAAELDITQAIVGALPR
jgi:outer membrane protein